MVAKKSEPSSSAGQSLVSVRSSTAVAIVTRYLGPTDFRGARIVANAGHGRRVIVPYRSDLESWDNHALAAQALCARLGWTGRLVGGYLPRGMVFVFEG